MSTTTERTRVSTNDFKNYGRLIAETLVEAINDHGVTYRDLDGTHLRLYCGNREVIPLKIARSRQPENQLKFILRWLGENVPSWNERHVSNETLARLKEAFNGTEVAVVDKTVDTKVEPRWVKAAVGPNKHDWGFETNGIVFRCAAKGCTHTQPSSKGLHLHAITHTDPKRQAEISGMGGRKAQTKRRAQGLTPQMKPITPVVEPEPERPMVASVEERNGKAVIEDLHPTPATPEQEEHAVQQALIILAAAHGMTLIPEAELAALRARLAEAEQMLAEASHERDEAKARLAIIQEAMSV